MTSSILSLLGLGTPSSLIGVVIIASIFFSGLVALIFWKLPAKSIANGVWRLLGAILAAPVMQLRKSARFFQDYTWNSFKSLSASEQFLSLTVAALMHVIILLGFLVIAWLGFNSAVQATLPNAIIESRDTTMTSSEFDSLENIYPLIAQKMWSYRDLGRLRSKLDDQIDDADDKIDSLNDDIEELNETWEKSGKDTIEARKGKIEADKINSKKTYERALLQYQNGLRPDLQEMILLALKSRMTSLIQYGTEAEVKQAVFYLTNDDFSEFPDFSEQYLPILKLYAAWIQKSSLTFNSDNIRTVIQPQWGEAHAKLEYWKSLKPQNEEWIQGIDEERDWHFTRFFSIAIFSLIIGLVWVMFAGLIRESIVLILDLANNVRSLKKEKENDHT